MTSQATNPLLNIPVKTIIFKVMHQMGVISCGLQKKYYESCHIGKILKRTCIHLKNYGFNRYTIHVCNAYASQC